MKTLSRETTTERVVARPTPSAPPETFKPMLQAMVTMSTPKTPLLRRPMPMSLKATCWKRVSDEEGGGHVQGEMADEPATGETHVDAEHREQWKHDDHGEKARDDEP